MTKSRIIVLSLLLIGASLLIIVLVDDSNTSLDKGLVSFFSGILMGAGIMTLINELFSRKKRVVTDRETAID
jgi:hypothetical protein